MQMVAAYGTWSFGLQVVGLVWSCGLCVQHTSPHRTHAHTPNNMLPHHHIDFLHFYQILKSVTLTRNIRAPRR